LPCEKVYHELTGHARLREGERELFLSNAPLIEKTRRVAKLNSLAEPLPY